MKVRSPHKVYVPRMSPPINALSPCTCPPTIWRGTNPPICKRPRENPAGSCQCSVDPVLSSHDAPYFETYLSSQAFFTFVTTWAVSMQCWSRFKQSWRALFWNVPVQSGIFYICYYLSCNGSLLYPFPLPFLLNSAKLHTVESLWNKPLI